MSEISFFQQYSQKENHNTNNTLLMLRHIYRDNPLKFQKLLNALTETELTVGITFQQQVKESYSIPDGTISQKPFRLDIEAKDDGCLHKEQIQRHAKSIQEYLNNDGHNILLGLTKANISDTQKCEYDKICETQGITFFPVTYHQLIGEIEKLYSDYHEDMREIIEDFHAYLKTRGLLPNPYEMVAFPCGRSHGPNIRHQVYFEPERRPNKENIPFIGIYKNKTITHIGRLKKSVIAKAKDLELILSEDADLKDLEKQKILNILNDEETRKNFSDLHNVFRRYYIIHDMIEVNMIKETPHGMPGLRYYDLNKIADGKIQDWNNMDHIAEVLKGKAFEK